jgi:calcineurin-like phosphoesterase family protein
MSKKWYTSDQHFWHNNIIKYCKRPFDNQQQMNDAILTLYNETIGPNDEVYHLGDICFYEKKAIELLEQMNGRKHLVSGNHDAKKLARWIGWETSQAYKEIKDEGRKVILCHYPIWSWNGMYRLTTHLHGHCHATKAPGKTRRSADVGVDAWDFKPVTLDQIEEQMARDGYWNTDDLDIYPFADGRRPGGIPKPEYDPGGK